MEEIRSSNTTCLIAMSFGILIDAMAYSICAPFLPFILQDPLEISSLLSAYGAGILVSSPVIGVVSDRLGYRKPLILIGLVILLFGTLLFAFVRVYWVMLVARIIQGLASGMMWTLGLALVADRFESDLGVAMGFVFSAYTGGQLLAPVLGGVLYEKLGYVSSFIFIAILIAIDFGIQLFFIEFPSNAENKHNDGKREVQTFAGFFKLFLNFPLMIIMVMIAASGCILACIDIFLPLYLKQDYQFESLNIGLTMLAFVVPEVVFSPLAGWIYDRIGFKSVFLGVLLATGMFPVAGLSKGIYLLIASLILLAIGMSIVSAPFLAEISLCVPKSSYAQAYGLLNVAISIGMFLGPFVGSVIFESYGWMGECVSQSILLALCFPLLLFYKRPIIGEEVDVPVT